MTSTVSQTDLRSTSRVAARLSFGAAAAAVAALAGLHVLSPEFDPAWRMVSEYANGHHGWVLSLMFVAWAVSSWALVYAIEPEVSTPGGRVGLFLLAAAGVGEAMAAAFDINHPALHGVAGFIGILSLPVGALLISVSLVRKPAWSAAKKAMLWMANLTWITVVLMAGSLIVMGVTFARAGGHAPVDGKSLPLGTTLPPGVVTGVGYANRLLVVVYCAWVMVVAWHAVRFGSEGAAGAGGLTGAYLPGTRRSGSSTVSEF